ncbi:innexin-like [Tropilaelaps mercedesae]|uniref:Innexin n=1 Tax=Tropilaelaps mercedesae TaxID=418985 RepID=A0A1V9XXR6_9ACAR|nr:innexin-like [Tropilaelaps mercedesae]
MKALIAELTDSSKSKVPILTKDDFEKKAKTIRDYFVGHRFENQKYAYRFFFCEILAFINVVVQIFLMDRFLGFQFWTYGPRAISFLAYDPEERVDPMAQVFPKMSKCRLRRFGTSGEVQIHDAICLLSLNILNEKIFVALWFWFVLLASVSFVNLIYRFVMLNKATKKYRYLQIKFLASMVTKGELATVRNHGTCGDWFMLSLIKDNVKAHHFKHVVTTLSDALVEEKSKSGKKDEARRLIKNQGI